VTKECQVSIARAIIPGRMSVPVSGTKSESVIVVVKSLYSVENMVLAEVNRHTRRIGASRLTWEEQLLLALVLLLLAPELSMLDPESSLLAPVLSMLL
jgi:hypothetical protein